MIGGCGELRQPPVTGRSASFRLRFRFVRVSRAMRASEAKLRGRKTIVVLIAGPPGWEYPGVCAQPFAYLLLFLCMVLVPGVFSGGELVFCCYWHGGEKMHAGNMVNAAWANLHAIAIIQTRICVAKHFCRKNLFIRNTCKTSLRLMRKFREGGGCRASAIFYPPSSAFYELSIIFDLLLLIFCLLCSICYLWSSIF